MATATCNRPVAGLDRVVGIRLPTAVLPQCRVPARRPGDFHLRPQMKVTKAKGLNPTPYGSFFALRTLGPAGHLDAPWVFDPASGSAGLAARFGLGPEHVRWVRQARYPEACPPSALSDRLKTVSPGRPPGRASAACRTRERCCLQGLCFGDFHLAPQMKVTRPPGRDPALRQSTTHRQVAPGHPPQVNSQRPPRGPMEH
jgi:hypothetical protein